MTWVATVEADIVRVTGNDRVDLLHRLSTNDLLPLTQVGTVRSTLFTTAQGRLIDWVNVVAIDDALLLVCAPGRGARVAEWIETYTIMEDVRSVLVHDWSLVVLDGEGALAAVGGEVPQRGTAVQRDGVWLWRGVAAYDERVEVLVARSEAEAFITRVASSGIERAGAQELELARVRAGVPGPSGEYPDDVNPLELRLGPVAVSFRKGCYIGQEVISRLDSYDKVARLLVGFSVDPGAVLPYGAGELKLTRDGRPFGRVTSLVPRPDGGAEGLAVVKREGSDEAAAELLVGEMTVPVHLERRPFPG